jgi:translation initiation factor IF-1
MPPKPPAPFFNLFSDMTTQYPSQYVDCICTIRERFAPTAYHATLPNGKETVAFVQSKEAHLLEVIQPGDKVNVTICPADFERARIRSMA